MFDPSVPWYTADAALVYDSHDFSLAVNYEPRMKG